MLDETPWAGWATGARMFYRDWLEGQGYSRSQVFLDLDEFRTGDRWRARLDETGGMCEAVIVCLSDNWITSPECVREFTHAESRGKPIFPVVVRSITTKIPTFVSAIQFGDISTPDREASGFDKLKAGLLGAQIAPSTFRWPPANEPARSVYRGLQALDVQDAAIFFGRDAHITQGLDELRRLRDGAPKRIMVILGASGAGKSSFLRAGLIARLKRDEENFLVLPILRPERAAISGAQGLTASVSAAIGRPVALSSAADLAQAFGELRKPVMERLTRNAEAAREAYASKPPTIIIPLDQAEELFGADNTERAKFSELVSGAITEDGNSLLVATIRSDSYEPFQTEQWLAGLPQLLFNLPPIVAGAFREIIEGPARLARPPITVEPALTQQLLADLDKADALPMLAFALERLQTQFGNDGKLTLTHYAQKLGGLAGAIQSAVDAALGISPSRETLALARALFVPALVQVDQDGVKRRAASRLEIPTDAQALLDRFIEQRLIMTDLGEVELTHEAILRQWPTLAAWISEEREALLILDGVRVSAREWSKPGRAQEQADDWMTHHGERRATAQSVIARPEFRHLTGATEKSYLEACAALDRRATEAADFEELRRSELLYFAHDYLKLEEEHFNNLTYERFGGYQDRRDHVRTLMGTERRWHPMPAEYVEGHGKITVQFGDSELYRFPCCGLQQQFMDCPSQFRSDGCSEAPRPAAQPRRGGTYLGDLPSTFKHVATKPEVSAPKRPGRTWRTWIVAALLVLLAVAAIASAAVLMGYVAAK